MRTPPTTARTWKMLRGSRPSKLRPMMTRRSRARTPQDIYRAACRVAMRLVVILFAESRELLPRDDALYHESYGLNGLLERLERAATRGGALAASFGAWPRVLALFRLVRDGSHHPDLPVTAYGGDLFAAGVSDAPDGLSRALHVFENACFAGRRGRRAAGRRRPRDAEAPHPHLHPHPPGTGRHAGGGSGRLLRPLLRVHRHPLRGPAGLRAEDRPARRPGDLPLGG